MRVSTISRALPTNLSSLRSDLERFIHPLAHRLRHGGVPPGLIEKHRRNNNNNKSESSAEITKPVSNGKRSPGVRIPVTYFSNRMNDLLNKPLKVTLSDVDVNVPLYRCPICASSEAARGGGVELPWMTPQEITRHMSWLHASGGSTQSSFATYNAMEIERLFNSLPSSASDSSSCGSVASLCNPRVVVLIDVANLELNTEDVLFDLLTKKESLLFFSRVACAFVCIHEVFITHTSRPGHVFFQLSRMHPHSDMFTLYAATRTESGDIVSASLMGDLLLRNVRGCGPATVLLTKDQVQKICVSQLFSGIAGKGGRVYLPRCTTNNILSSLREANNAIMG